MLSKSKANPLEVISDSENQIKFCGPKNKNGVFSSFYSSPIKLKGKLWKTAEHYYQAQKFAETEKEIRNASSPGTAVRLGRRKYKNFKLRDSWNDIKEIIMYEALIAKFTQHKKLQNILISTQDNKLIESSKRDAYWGNGVDGKGKNRLGVLLMRLRQEFIENYRYIENIE